MTHTPTGFSVHIFGLYHQSYCTPALNQPVLQIFYVFKRAWFPTAATTHGHGLHAFDLTSPLSRTGVRAHWPPFSVFTATYRLHALRATLLCPGIRGHWPPISRSSHEQRWGSSAQQLIFCFRDNVFLTYPSPKLLNTPWFWCLYSCFRAKSSGSEQAWGESCARAAPYRFNKVFVLSHGFTSTRYKNARVFTVNCISLCVFFWCDLYSRVLNIQTLYENVSLYSWTQY
jgi:hypothetical protein